MKLNNINVHQIDNQITITVSRGDGDRLRELEITNMVFNYIYQLVALLRELDDTKLNR